MGELRYKGYLSLVRALEEFGEENTREVFTAVYNSTRYADFGDIVGEICEGKRREIDEVNKILIYIFNSWEKEPFNGLIVRWVDNFLKAIGKTLEDLGDNPISRIENYHAIVAEEYMGKKALDVEVSEEKDGIINVRMKDCPYKQFCETTGNRKCVRGTVLKYLLEGTGIVTLLEKKGNECYLKLRDGPRAVDEFIDTIKKEVETGKREELYML